MIATIKQLVIRNRGVSDSEEFDNFRLNNPQVLGETAQDIMRNVPPTFGACAMISSLWAAFLREQYSIPAIVVAGDLKVTGRTVFKCKKNIPDASKSGKQISSNWGGHCWIEIDDWIGDLSIFRTAYQIQGDSHLKSFVLDTFGSGRGVLISKKSELPAGMKYVPKFVLTDGQIDGLVCGLTHQMENGT